MAAAEQQGPGLSVRIPTSSYFRYGIKNIPHIDKRDKGGEDAFTATESLLVVADGVGGWGDVGVDPGLFSKQLVSIIREIYL